MKQCSYRILQFLLALIICLGLVNRQMLKISAADSYTVYYWDDDTKNTLLRL